MDHFQIELMTDRNTSLGLFLKTYSYGQAPRETCFHTKYSLQQLLVYMAAMLLNLRNDFFRYLLRPGFALFNFPGNDCKP